MPSDSIAGFLDQAQANRVLYPEQVEQLIHQPDVPQSNLDSLCAYLEEHHVLTRFQAEMLRQGRGYELNYAGYPVLDEIGPCPGGTAYRATHPSLRTPVVLRRFRTDALGPADTPTALVQRAQAAAHLHHPNVATLLDANPTPDGGYAALDEPTDASTLDALVKLIGPAPGFLAAEYGREIASGLRAAHERGLWHGDVRPANAVIGPMTSKTRDDGTVRRRPAPNAAVKLAELGLVPVRPPAGEALPPAEELAYLPPERIDATAYDPRADLYGLGATLYYLFTGRPPVAGRTPDEVLHNLRTADPISLAALRPDVPPELAAYVHQLLARRPDERPHTAFDAELALSRFCRPGTVPQRVVVGTPTPQPQGSVAEITVGYDPPAIPEATAVFDSSPNFGATTADVVVHVEDDEWGAADHQNFSTSHADSGPIRKAPMTAGQRQRNHMLLMLGLVLNLAAVALGVLLAFQAGCFDSKADTDPPRSKRNR